VYRSEKESIGMASPHEPTQKWLQTIDENYTGYPNGSLSVVGCALSLL